jgi:hypothetical protein
MDSKFSDPPDHEAACHFPVEEGEDMTKDVPQIAASERDEAAIGGDLMDALGKDAVGRDA